MGNFCYNSVVDQNSFKALFSPSGQGALQAAVSLQPREVDYLRHFQTLCRSFPPDLARAALETAILRGAARHKFPLADAMYFTREALEQASAFEVSTYRAMRYASFSRLVDLGCSIGGDSLALAALAPTIGIDRDSLRLLLAQANLAAAGLAERVHFVRADLQTALPMEEGTQTALFFDPGRRSQGRRIYSVEAYQPPLGVVAGWQADFPAIGVKISPGVDLAELAPYEAEVEFISLHGELKEAVLWFGSLKSTGRRATILPEAHTLCSLQDFDLAPGIEDSGTSAPLAYIYEPDPAVLRAGLVMDLAAQLEAFQLDRDIAYLTAERGLPTPFARAWAIEAWFPFGLKRLRSYLRERHVGRVTVKKRGSPLQPEALIHDLRLSGDQERVVFLTHLRGNPIVVIGIPYFP
jgi:hypothetical protein